MLSQTTHAPAPRLLFSTPETRVGDKSQLSCARKCFPRNAEIFGETEPVAHIYQVVSGAVRAYRILDDGRRQIVAFYLPGDLFGFESGGVHMSSTEAICASEIALIRVKNAMTDTSAAAEVAPGLWSLITEELRRMQDHMILLVRNAEERVAHFLLEMSRRTGNLATVNLPMSRQDIADYLGITIETVSRTLTHLEQSGTISLRTSRQIELCRRSALARLDS